jgi:phosphoribosylanthranilate isomerase
MTRVKICGLRDKNHALAAVDAGADFIGLVFAPSKRQVNPAKAYEIASVVKESSDTIKVVGVFVNTPSSRVNELADYCALDWIQLSGDESWEYCREVVRPVIKAIRIDRQSQEELHAELSTGSKMLPPQEFIALLDSRAAGKYGGTGESFDWTLAQELAKGFPVIIAGGLNPKNVARLIETVAPWGVDVSSGVETGGVKDTDKIKTFIEEVRKVDERRHAAT